MNCKVLTVAHLAKMVQIKDKERNRWHLAKTHFWLLGMLLNGNKSKMDKKIFWLLFPDILMTWALTNIKQYLWRRVLYLINKVNEWTNWEWGGRLHWEWTCMASLGKSNNRYKRYYNLKLHMHCNHCLNGYLFSRHLPSFSSMRFFLLFVISQTTLGSLEIIQHKHICFIMYSSDVQFSVLRKLMRKLTLPHASIANSTTTSTYNLMPRMYATHSKIY